MQVRMHPLKCFSKRPSSLNSEENIIESIDKNWSFNFDPAYRRR